MLTDDTDVIDRYQTITHVKLTTTIGRTALNDTT